jgi:hypothetical protein
MARSSPSFPAWRVFGAAAGAFALGFQLLVTGWLIGQMAGPAGQVDAAVICARDSGASSGAGGGAPAPASHKGCYGGCWCPQFAKLLAPPPTLFSFVVLRPHLHAPHADLSVVATLARSPSPYASRAPPISA